MARVNTINMTSGRPLPKILLFCLPLAASGILQILFNAADVIVVGKFVGSTSLAAVGSTGSLINLLIGLFLGLSVGVNVTTARLIGAGDEDGVHRMVQTTVLMAAALGMFVLALGSLLAHPMLHMMNVPEDVLPLAKIYIRIYFFGVPASLVYNFCAGILRAYGDTKRPFLFLTIAGASNALMNLFFVLVLHIGVAGVALATVISQYISCALVLRSLARMEGAAHLDLRRPRFDRESAVNIVRIGFPAGLTSVLFSLSNVLIQSTVNTFGSAVVAANTAVNNLDMFTYMACNSVYHAAISFTSQNYGAQRTERLLPVMRDCMIAVLIIGLPLSACEGLFGRQLMTIYVSRSDPARDVVLSMGVYRIFRVSIFYFICGLMECANGLVRGLGRSWLPMFVSLTGSCLFRIVWLQTAFRLNPTLPTMYLCYPLSWVVTTAMHMTCFILIYRKLRARQAAAQSR